MHAHACIHAHTHAFAHTHRGVDKHVFKQWRIWNLHGVVFSFNTCTHMHAYMHTHMHTHMHLHTHPRTHAHAHTHRVWINMFFNSGEYGVYMELYFPFKCSYVQDNSNDFVTADG